MEIVNAEKKPNRSISQRWQLNYGWKWDFEWLWKFMKFLYNIHSIICHILIISISISSAFIYSHWYLERSDFNAIINTNTEAVIY